MFEKELLGKHLNHVLGAQIRGDRLSSAVERITRFLVERDNRLLLAHGLDVEIVSHDKPRGRMSQLSPAHILHDCGHIDNRIFGCSGFAHRIFTRLTGRDRNERAELGWTESEMLKLGPMSETSRVAAILPGLSASGLFFWMNTNEHKRRSDGHPVKSRHAMIPTATLIALVDQWEQDCLKR